MASLNLWFILLRCSPVLLLVPITSLDLILFSDTFLGFRLSLLRVFNTSGLEIILPRLVPLLLATRADFSFLCCSCWVNWALEFGVADSIRRFTLDGKIFYAFNHASRALYRWTRMLLDSYGLLLPYRRAMKWIDVLKARAESVRNG
jgi:hypothetical protein